MATIFEYWNGGTAVHNGRFAGYMYDFPPVSQEVVIFFQLSGRIWEVLMGQDCFLQMAGHVLDVPNFPANEINAFVESVQKDMGYTPRLVNTMGLGPYGNLIPTTAILWVNLGTGRADTFNHTQGHIINPPILHPMNNFNSNFYQQYNSDISPNGAVSGSGVTKTLKSIAEILTHSNSILKQGSEIYKFFDQEIDWFGGDNGSY